MINYINSLLSDITYLDYNIENGKYVLKSTIDNTYEKRNISLNEKDFFSKNFEIIDQKVDNFSGFGATTFRVTTDNVPGYKKGEIFIAYRGTEFPTAPDLIYDAFGPGLGFGSLLDAISHPLSYIGINIAQTTQARNYVVEMQAKFNIPTDYPSINVTGHSLGGYLATYATITNNDLIKNTITYNAPAMTLLDGFVARTLNLFTEETVQVTEDGVTKEIITSASDKITHYYSETGPEFTSLSMPVVHSHLGTRVGIYTEDNGMIENHSVRYNREIMLVYETLSNLIMKTTTLDKNMVYGTLTNHLSNYRYPEVTITEKPDTLLVYENHLKYIKNMTGLTGDGVDLLYYINRYATTFKAKIIDANFQYSANMIERRSQIYAITNYVPFHIYYNTVPAALNKEVYNPLNYHQQHLDARLEMFKKIMNIDNNSFIQGVVDKKSSTGVSHTLNYTFINYLPSSEEANSSKKMAFIDEDRRLVLLQNMTREEYYLDKSIEKHYFMSYIEDFIPTYEGQEVYPLVLEMFGNNSKVFDSIGSDFIHIKGQNASVYLTKGNDQVHIDVEEASIGLINIMDNGIGDKFYFKGGNLDNNIIGTKYSDDVKGNDGSDSINGLEGSDTLYGGVGSDTLDGGMGDDTIYGNDYGTKMGDISDENYVNIINGGYGIDSIYGGEGKDIINNVATSDGSFIGKHSTDRVSKNYGDFITGGWGDDEIYGTAYGDKYIYYKGDGNDTIIDRVIGASTNIYQVDIIMFNGISFSETTYKHHNTSDLYIYVPSFVAGVFSEILLKGFMTGYIIEKFHFNNEEFSLNIDYTEILNKSLERTALINTELLGNDIMSISHVETLRGLDGTINIIKGGYGKDIIIGGDQGDIIGDESLTSSSYLGNSGTRSNAYYGDDITGGKGNDTIYGTRYADTYRYNKGDGNDIISDHSSRSDSSIYLIDKLILGEGISRENLIITRNFNNDLILKFEFVDKDNNGQILIKNFLNGYGIEKIVFHDGSIIDSNEMFNQALIYQGRDLSGEVEEILGTKYADTIYGNKGDDKIFAGTGNDSVYGGSGEDEIYGETGDDVLNGDSGNDKLDGGYGKDTLNGGEGNDILNYSIKINGKNSESYKSVATYSATVNYGDILNGGKGNDEIYGTIYGDTYNYSLGDGKDSINELGIGSGAGAFIDVINFGEGINPDEVKFERDNFTAILKFKDGGEIRIENFYNDFKIEKFTFLDGTIWDWTHIRDNTPLLGTENTDYLYGSDVAGLIEYIKGFGGNDFLYGLSGINYIDGGDGNDIIGYADKVNTSSNGSSTITGGKGDDELYGSTSTDIYKFNIGDGNDIILDSTGSLIKKIDKISFGEGIVFEHLVFNRTNHKDLTIHYTNNDSIIIKNFYYEDGIDYVNNYSNRRGPSLLEFDDGYIYDLYLNPQTVNIMEGTDEGEEFYALYTAETIYAGGGDDKIIETYRNSVISNRYYYGEGGDDNINLFSATTINGGDGNDIIQVAYANTILGEAGNDTITITNGATYVSGGAGNDKFILNANASLYFNINDGTDYLDIRGGTVSPYINLNFNTSINNVSIFGSLYSTYKGQNKTYLKYSNNDMIDIGDNDLYTLIMYANLNFTDAENVNFRQLLNNIIGTDNNDFYNLFNVSEAKIKAGDGNDEIVGSYSNESIYMYGEKGDDTLTAQNGNVYMNGGSDSDTYIWKGNRSNINIDDNNGYDKLFISYNNIYGNEQNVSYSNIRMVKSGFDLVIFKGESTLTVNNQFIEGYGVDQIGSGLFRHEFELMIDLMAQYDATSDSTEHTRLNSEMSRLWQ